MGSCSAKTQKNSNRQENSVMETKQRLKKENSLETSKVNKSERSIKTNSNANQTPKRQGQLISAQNQSVKGITRTALAIGLMKHSQYRGTLKTCVSIQNVTFSKNYSIISNSKIPCKVQLNEQMALVQHNLSGNIRVAELIKKNNSGTYLAEEIVKNQLQHPNLIKIFDIFQDGTNYQIIHDFCNGGQLSLNCSKGPLTQQQIAITLKQIIDVILYLHTHGLHHDFLTLQSFQKCNQSNSNYIKLTEFKSIFIKTKPLDQDYIYYQSPEAIKISDLYSFERDSWSIGVILYKLLSGSYPFKGSNQEQIYEAIAKYSQCDNLDFRSIPPECIELIKSFLKIDPKQRIKLSDALDDQWLQSHIQQSEKEINGIVKQLDNNHPLSFLQCCFLQYMITTLQQDQDQHLYQLFCQFDSNHDGKVNRKDLTQAYLKYNSDILDVKEQVDSIFKGMDFNCKGEIDFQEFKIGVIDKGQLLTEENLRETFKMLSDVEGYITVHKMSSLYSNKKEQLKIHFSIYENNQINFKQFEDLMYDAV